MGIEIRAARPDEGDAQRLIRDYMTEVVARWWGRAAEPFEVDRAMRDEPSDDLADPTGILLVAHVDGVPSGIAGMRLPGNGIGELTKVFTALEARGAGVAGALLDRIEREARERGLRQVRLETRSDLVEAIRLSERRGYAPVEPFGEPVYTDRWYALRVDTV